jgi:hypothetical protein
MSVIPGRSSPESTSRSSKAFDQAPERDSVDKLRDSSRMLATGLVSKGVLLLGLCFVLVGCGSSGDDNAPMAGGGSSGEAGALGEAGNSGTGGAPVGAAGKPNGDGGSSDGGSSDGGSSDGGAAGAAVREPEVLDPPASINLTLCDGAGDSLDACDLCCHDNGFSASSTYQGKCVCGTHTEDDAVCATETAVQCFGCCATAGYAATTFAMSVPSQCTCQDKFDSTLCPSARNAAEPVAACAICCLNKGYLASDYDMAGGGVCTCSAI